MLRAFPRREYTLVAAPTPLRMGRFDTPVQPVATRWTFTSDSGTIEADVCENGRGRTCTKTFTQSGVLTLVAVVNGERMTSAPLRVQMPALSMNVSHDSVTVGDTVLVTTTVAGLDTSALSYFAVSTFDPQGRSSGFALTGAAPVPNGGGVPPCLRPKPVPTQCHVVLTQPGRAHLEVGAFLDARGLAVMASRDIVVKPGARGRVVIDAAAGSASGDVRIRPSEIVGIRSAPYVSTTSLRVRVLDAAGRAIPDIDVDLSLEAEEFSGGHEHGSVANARPAGIFPMNGARTIRVNTGPSGEVVVRYQAPDPAGLVTVRGVSTGQQPAELPITIAFEGLVLQEEMPGILQHVGQPGSHHGRFWVSYTTRDMLMQLADTLSKEYEGVVLPSGATRYLALNDASLVYGGQFDINGNWSPPHAGHRRGQGADLRTTDTTEDQADFMTSYWELVLGGAIYDETLGQNPQSTGPHYHFKECSSCTR